MPADTLIEALCEQNGVSREPRLPPNPRLRERSVSWPPTFEVNEALLKGAIERRSDICLLSPTLKHEYMELFALSSLFKLMSSGRARFRVLVLTADPDVRKRFKHLSPGHRREWSKERFPVATVQSDGSIREKTTSWPDTDREPRALFSRHLHYLPNAEVSRDIGCVIYDASVNFKHDRWEAFHDWRTEHNVPTITYCLRDPLALEYRDVSGREDVSMWAWPTALLDAVLSDDYLISATDSAVSSRETRVRHQLANKVDGIDREIHAVTEGELADTFVEIWEQIEDLQEIQDQLESDELQHGIRILKRALNVFSNVVASMNFTSQAYREEWGSMTPTNWFDKLDHHRQRILDDPMAKQAVGPYRNACMALEELYESWPDIDVADKKQGHLYRLLYGSLDEDESVRVVVPKDSDRKAVTLDLQQRGGDLYESLDDRLQVVTPDTFAAAATCDRVIIAGPPRWRNRWVLRTPHAPAVTFLAYEHQLPLLDYQLMTLNETLRDTTERPIYRQAVRAARDGGNGASPSDSIVEQVEVEGLNLDIGEESDVAKGYEVVETHEPTSVDEIIDEMRRREASRQPSTAQSNDRSSTASEPISCIRLCFEDGQSMPVRPGDDIYVIDTNSDGVTRRSVRRIQHGNTLVTIRQTEDLREQLYNLIKRKGDDRLIMQAELWKIKLEQAIDAADDTFDDFITRLEQEGADRGRDTYRGWYNLEVDYTREYADMERIAAAYDLTAVEGELDDIWDAAQQIKSTYKKLLRELRKRAYRATVGKDHREVILSEEHDIRLSDIDTYDDQGESLVERHTVVETFEDEVSRRRLGTILSRD